MSSQRLDLTQLFNIWGKKPHDSDLVVTYRILKFQWSGNPRPQDLLFKLNYEQIPRLF